MRKENWDDDNRKYYNRIHFGKFKELDIERQENELDDECEDCDDECDCDINLSDHY